MQKCLGSDPIFAMRQAAGAASCWLLLLGSTHAVRLGGAHAVAPVSLALQRNCAPLMASTEEVLTEIEQMVSAEVTSCPSPLKAPGGHSPSACPLT